MEIVHDAFDMQARCAALKREGKRIALVPTMGWLHDGHLSLLREGRKRADVLALSVFVNPLQFGAGEDFDAYPRNLMRDAALAEKTGADLLFAPQRDALYPADFSTHVEVSGLTETLCGKSRPGHFRGVATVVTKLFNIVRPDVALFGRKDFQQLAAIRRMVRDLDMGIEVVGMPIVREADGLAMSSRNTYLGADERRQALALVESLRLAQSLAKGGETDAASVLAKVTARIGQEPLARLDYAQICHDETLADMEKITANSVLLLAVYFGATRLIDNAYLLKDELPK